MTQPSRASSASASRRWAVAAAGVATVLFVLSSIPAPMLARTGIQLWDKAEHAGAWSVLGYCLGRALGASPRRALLAVALGIAYGGVDELHQSFTPGRDVSGWDVMADAVGSLVGVGVAAWTTRRKR